MDLTTQIEKIFTEYLEHLKGQKLQNAPLFRKMKAKILKSQELVFLLPAFPAKSPSPAKTSGAMPDLGEVLALQGLNELCEKISDLYEPGARIVICSDGRVFSDVVRVSDEQISEYQKGIQDIVTEFNLSKISLFALDDLFPDKSADQMRDVLLDTYARSVEDVRNLVLLREDYKKLFNGLHKFLLEDELELNPDISKNKATQETKIRTYELMRRSDAWSELLNGVFPDELRLSIHPYKIEHEKFGIKLISSSSKWATPWHNVTVKIRGRFELMHLKEALSLNAIPKLARDKYAYFEIANV
jgi:pyoverdine/dityrosine biosynthesis protein Dit1